MLLLLAACGVGLFAFAYINGFQDSITVNPLKNEPAKIVAPDWNGKTELARHDRIVYPYSIISGGVRSREELIANMADDPVVSAHFSDFKISRTRMARAEKPQFVHVSYRMRDQVFWTAKLLKIPEGEALITDGSEVARARCGNRVSAAPKEPVSEEEPLIETLDIPMVGGLQSFSTEPIPEPTLALREFSPLDPFITIQEPNILPYYYRPLFVIRTPPDYYVPEPCTLSLLFAGLAAFLAIKQIRKHRQ